MSTAVPDPSPDLLQRAATVRRSAMALGQCSDADRRAAVLAMADALETPERRLERIADLRGKGLHEEADRALAEFLRTMGPALEAALSKAEQR